MNPISRHIVSPSLALILLVAVAACSSNSATPTPSPTPTTAAPASVVIPSIGLPSGALPSGITLPSAGAGPDPATLVSADMAASVIGGSPQQVQVPALSGLPVKVASYATSTGDTLSVFVEQVPGGVPAAALQAAIAMGGAQGSGLQTVSGIGDAAAKSVETNNAVVAFIKGDLIVVIGAQSGTAAGSDLEPKIEALAKQVAGKV